MGEGSRPTWRRSSHSTSGENCVEITTSVPGLVGVRDSVDPDGPKLALSPSAWRELTDRIKGGGLSL